VNDQRITDLLHEAADAIEPRHRIEAVRAATRSPGRRGGRGWWAAGGVGLVAASVVTALVLASGDVPDGAGLGPADGPTSTSTPTHDPTSAAPDRSERQDRLEQMRRASQGVHAVYYVGDTPLGPRLYRQLLTMDPADPLGVAVAAAVGSTPDGRRLPPEDPDYRVLWPPLTTASAQLASTGDVIDVSLGGDPQDDLRSAGALTPEEARLALEAVVRTAQDAVGEQLPVRFRLFGEPADTVLGVATSTPVTTGPDLDVLAHVSLSTPFEGQVVDNDEPFTVTGAGTGFEGNIVTRIQRWEGTSVVDQVPTIASGEGTPRLWPFSVTFDLGDVAPGDYVVISQTEDPSGQGDFFTDTRRITVVD
jgi:hypothetical protein